MWRKTLETAGTTWLRGLLPRKVTAVAACLGGQLGWKVQGGAVPRREAGAGGSSPGRLNWRHHKVCARAKFHNNFKTAKQKLQHSFKTAKQKLQHFSPPRCQKLHRRPSTLLHLPREAAPIHRVGGTCTDVGTQRSMVTGAISPRICKYSATHPCFATPAAPAFSWNVKVISNLHKATQHTR